MRKKRLIPHTIIPPDLYVHRSADRQLRQVISEMGRPGYVLVARQMGKTNLLLNAKRELETVQDAIIYVDLSAPFASERECFRHIIDTALETREKDFVSARAQVINLRKDTTLPSYKEHELELRALLSDLPGKLVIILDEIDSLTKGTFSDKVFAQIRSVYFSRANFHQFNRLTYILSGVAEPNEIIKDKRISPFNIGEKIYLDDFTQTEFSNFLERACLPLNTAVKESIYQWASGNPRLTWDICSDLEDKLHAGYFITVEEVESTVKKLYLQDFNTAPVDHIREIVASDDELRNAITVLKYGKGDTLPDSIKSKLYLAGITRFAQQAQRTKIKNLIIEQALSDQWLNDIAIKRKGLLKLAGEQFDAKNYEMALKLYEDLIRAEGLSDSKRPSTYHCMGLCAYWLGQYGKALDYFNQASWDKAGEAALYRETMFFTGVCHYELGELENSRARFEEVFNLPKRDFHYITALLNVGATYTLTKEYDKAIPYYEKALAEAPETDLTSDEQARLSASAFYNLGKTYEELKIPSRAQECFKKALISCPANQKPGMMLALYNQIPSPSERPSYLGECIELILDQSIRPTSPHPERNFTLTTVNFYQILIEAYEQKIPRFTNLFEYVLGLNEFNITAHELWLRLAFYSLQRRNSTIAARLAREVVGKNVIPSPKPAIAFQTYRLLALITKTSDKNKFREEYVRVLEEGYDPSSIDYLDLTILSDFINFKIEKRELFRAKQGIFVAKRLLPKVSEEDVGSFAVIYYLEMLLLEKTQQIDKLPAAAESTLGFIRSLKSPESATKILGVDGLKGIQTYAETQLMQLRLPVPHIKTSKPAKIGRNDRVTVRYADGQIRKDVKFKHVERELAGGICSLVNSEK